MNFPPASRTTTLRASFALVVALGLAACASESGSRRGSLLAGPGVAPPAPAPSMAAHGLFFDGQIEAEVLLGRGGFEPLDGAKSEPPSGGGGARSGFSMGGGGRRGGGGGGRRGGGEGAGGPSENSDGTPAVRMVASNLPPVRLHLRLTNHGNEPVDIEVPDFNSDLGNFVVQPPKIFLLPNQPIEADPMTSTLGVRSDDIPLTVAIRAHGRIERQVLTLRIVPPAAPAAASTAPATTP